MAAKSNLTNMVVCLSLVCLVCSALLGGMYTLTKDPIAKANEQILKATIGEVLPEGGTLSDAMPVEVGGQPSEYYVSTVDGNPAAYAIKSSAIGFGGSLVLMVGLTPDGYSIHPSCPTARLPDSGPSARLTRVSWASSGDSTPRRRSCP